MALLYLKTKLRKYLHKAKELRNIGWRVICFSCRIKRIEQIDELESEKSQEYRDMEVMEDENNAMRIQLQDLQARYNALKKFALHRNLLIPPELD